jgi:uncharacterized delta-60 repeat protein
MTTTTKTCLFRAIAVSLFLTAGLTLRAATRGEALNAANLTWTSGGSAAWFAESTTTHDGVWAAQSGLISDSQETWMETTVTGPGPLSFWWKVSSESGYDNLEFYINGVRQTYISGEVGWQVQNYSLGTGTQVLRWRYVKDHSVSSGQDRGWVDQVSFANLGTNLGEALNATNLTWTSGGTAMWGAQSATTHDGLLAAQSGTIGNSQETWMETTMTGPGSLSFWWKVSSESGFDYLEFYINGVLQATRITGEVDWQQQNYTLDTGFQTLRWRYAKDESWSSGQDRGWVDQVSFNPSGPPVIWAQPASITNDDAGTAATFSVVAGGSVPLSFQWRKDGVALVDGEKISGAGTSALSLVNVLGGDAGGYNVVVSNGLGNVTSVVARLTVIDPLITVQPVSQSRDSGQSVSFSVTAAGTAPIGYQWWKDGVALSQGTAASVTLTNLQTWDAGQYRVVVNNQYGSVTSAVAVLTMSLPDPGFNPGAGSDVYSLAVQADGKILVGGYFTTLGGKTRNYIGRLNADGTVDSGFNPGANGTVYSLAVQADGEILVGGNFTTLGGQTRNYIGRLNADANGTVDSGFNPGASSDVYSLAVQADGKILVGGYFTTLGGQTRNYIGRLNADANGTVDSGFNPGASSDVYSLAVQADGKILVGGYFTTLGGQTRNCIGRLYNTTPATQSLTYDGSTITWLRGGTSPEVWRTTYDLSTDGLIWTNLGAGARRTGGWQLAIASAPPSGVIRARGQVTGGFFNGSGWFVESQLQITNLIPTIVQNPQSATNLSGTTATFTVGATGSAPLAYQWLKESMPLVDGGNIVGARTTVLLLTNVLGGDAGGYSVVVTNAFGSVTSAVARLTVLDPAIAVQPVSQWCGPGQSVTFSVTAAGTAPFGYQWWKDGLALPQGTNSSLLLTNLQASDSGQYRVVVSNGFGSVISAVALLTYSVPTMRYVAASSASPAPPYTNWATAAHVIQDAVDAALAGDEIVVTNGIYDTGERADYDGATNRVVIDKPVMVRSVRGPLVTMILGRQRNYPSPGPIRCVRLTNGASLSGFTLSNGAANYGAGVACSTDAYLTNCVLVGNHAEGERGGLGVEQTGARFATAR